MAFPQEQRIGRRGEIRWRVHFPLSLKIKTETGNWVAVEGETLTLSEAGLSCTLRSCLPLQPQSLHLTVTAPGHIFNQAGQLAWISPARTQCGIRFDGGVSEWKAFVESDSASGRWPALAGRRKRDRRQKDRRQ